MAEANYPSADPAHRRADLSVHLVGTMLILTAAGILIPRTAARLDPSLIAAVVVYAVTALASNQFSLAYHFAPWHGRRVLLRRIDHAAIYASITGTFTVFFVRADTVWTLTLLVVCWALTAWAMWAKITSAEVKARWSTASYLGLGAIGLSALPDMGNVPVATPWCILGGAACYVIGTLFYTRKTLPYRYAIWHVWVNLGAVMMFAGIWIALFTEN